MVLGVGVGYAVWADLESLSITLAAPAVACAAIIVRRRRTKRMPI